MPGLAATTTPAEPADLDALIAYAVAHHPRIRAGHHGARSAGAMAKAEGRWPDPRAMVSLSPIPADGTWPGWAMVQLNQGIPWPGELAARSEAAKASGRAGEASAVAATLSVARGVRVAAAAVRLAEAEARINAELIELADRLSELVTVRLAVGTAARTDLLLVATERARRDTLALSLAQRIRTARAALNLAAARPVEAPLPDLSSGPQPPAEAIDALLAWARAHHPALAGADAEIEATRARLRATDYRGTPRFEVGVGYMFMGQADTPAMQADTRRHGMTLSGGMTLPIWRDSYAAESHAAQQRVRAAEAEREDAERLLVYGLLEAHLGVETALLELRMYQEAVIPLARETVEALEAEYAGGGGDFLRLVEAERALGRLANDAAVAEAALAVRLADLEMAVGRPPAGAATGGAVDRGAAAAEETQRGGGP